MFYQGVGYNFGIEALSILYDFFFGGGGDLLNESSHVSIPVPVSHFSKPGDAIVQR